jgi:hypothetical protein
MILRTTLSPMAMGTRQPRPKQMSMWVATHDLPRTVAHPFYTRLNQILDCLPRMAARSASAERNSQRLAASLRQTVPHHGLAQASYLSETTLGLRRASAAGGVGHRTSADWSTLGDERLFGRAELAQSDRESRCIGVLLGFGECRVRCVSPLAVPVYTAALA